MPITNDHIKNSIRFVTGATFSIPDAGATTISVVAPSTGALTNDYIEGRYIYIPASGRTLRRCISVTAEDGLGNQVLTVEFPFDMSEFRAYERLDGTAFPATLPPAGSDYTISMDLDDLIGIISDVPAATGVSLVDATSRTYAITEEGLTITGGGGATIDPAGTNGQGVQLPENCALVIEEGTITGGVLRNLIMNRGHHPTSLLRIGKLHPGDINDATGDYYTSGGVNLIDEQIAVTSGAFPLTGENIGFNTQLVKGYLNLVNSVLGSDVCRFFMRMYSQTAPENEALQTNMLIDFEIQGQVGIRIAGDNTFIKDFTYQDGAWRGVNVRIANDTRTLGQLSGLRAQDSSNLFYQNWDDSGTTTVVDGFSIVNPFYTDSDSFKLIQSFGGVSGKSLILKNWDIEKWVAVEDADTDGDNIYFMTGGSTGETQSRVIAARDVNMAVIDSDGAALDADNDSKLFIYTATSTSHASYPDLTYTNTIIDGDGEFDTQLVHVRDFRIGSNRRFDDALLLTASVSVEYVSPDKPADISVRSRRYNTVVATNDLYAGDGAVELQSLMLDDPYHSSVDDVTLATIDEYDKLDTAQKLYDYSKRLMYENPATMLDDGSSDMFLSLDDNDILIPAQPAHVALTTLEVTNADDPRNILSYNQAFDLISVRTDTLATGGQFIGGFDLRVDGADAVHDLTIHDTIRGYVNCRNITLGVNNLVGGGGKAIIDTSHSVIGNMVLNGGNTYTVTGGANISNLNITRTAGDTDDVIISLVDYNATAGIPSPVPEGVVYQFATAITYQIEENFSEAVLSHYAIEFDSDDAEVTDGVTPTITFDNAADTFTLTYNIAHGNYVDVATWYLDYKNTFTKATLGAHDVEMVRYLPTEVSRTAITDADDDEELTPYNDYYTDGSENGWSIDFSDNRVVFTAPDTTITLPLAVAKAIMHRALGGRVGGLSSDEFLKQVCKKNIDHDVIDFAETHVIVKSTDFTDNLHNTMQWNHRANTTDILWNTQVLDQANGDRFNDISTTSFNTKVRFKPITTIINLGGDAASQFANQLKTLGVSRESLTNLGLGLPILNEAEDGFETTPNLPS